jgi:hypothetical protein
MPHVTINQKDVVELFHELMQPKGEFRVLRLLGTAKSGKSHFITKIFPALAQHEYHARPAIFDLRNSALDIIDVLHNAHDWFGGDDIFPNYCAAYQEWINHSKVNVADAKAILSYIQIKGEREPDESRKMIRILASQFVKDIKNIVDAPLVFLFDAVNEASEPTCTWLIETVLAQLAQVPHVRIVIGGRTLPEAPGGYTARCMSYELLPVEDEEAYIDFCRQIGAQLVEQSIRDIARLFEYSPGMFVDYVVPIFASGRGIHV